MDLLARKHLEAGASISSKAASQATVLSKWKVKAAQSCATLCNTMDGTRLLCPWDSPGKNTRVGCYSLFQGIFPTQGLNPGFLHCRQILYHLSHQGSPYSPQEGSWIKQTHNSYLVHFSYSWHGPTSPLVPSTVDTMSWDDSSAKKKMKMRKKYLQG